MRDLCQIPNIYEFKDNSSMDAGPAASECKIFRQCRNAEGICGPSSKACTSWSTGRVRRLSARGDEPVALPQRSAMLSSTARAPLRRVIPSRDRIQPRSRADISAAIRTIRSPTLPSLPPKYRTRLGSEPPAAETGARSRAAEAVECSWRMLGYGSRLGAGAATKKPIRKEVGGNFGGDCLRTL
jgi:hypothetical protein